MRQKLYTFLFIISLFSLNNTFAQDKNYVNPKNVTIADNGIFVNLDGLMITVNDIAYDEQGMYISSENLNNEDKQAWICQNDDCLTHNWSWRTTCYKCGTSR